MRAFDLCISIISVLGVAACAGSGSTASITSATPLGPAAQVAFKCPAAGMRTRVVTGSIRNTTTWAGADPADPVVCLTATSNGRSVRRLYGFIEMPMLSGETDARKAFAAAFGGSTDPSCYVVYTQANNVGGMNNHYEYKWCWQQAGHVMRDIGGKATDMIVFKASETGRNDNYFSADWTYYFDPAAEIWAEGDAVTNRGNPPDNFVRTVLPPNT